MMNQEGIFKKVGQILNELQDQYEFLARNPNQLNDLELELFQANANFLSDHVQIVKKFNSNKPIKEIPEHSADQSAAVIVAEPFEMSGVEAIEEEELKMEKGKTLEELETEYAVANEPKVVENEEKAVENDEVEVSNREPLKFEFEQQSIETIFDRTLSKEEEDIIAEKQRLRDSEQLNEKVEEAKIAAEPAETIPEPATPVVNPGFEKPSEPLKEPDARPTLNDLLASKSNVPSSLNDENNAKAKITDLKQAITLNEKLLYIKDLFNGYNLAYAEAIELINKMPDFTTADNFLRNNYAEKNNWSAKQSTVDMFYDLLNQRFDVK